MDQVPEFGIKAPARRSMSHLTKEKTYQNGNHLRFKDGEITNHLINVSLCLIINVSFD